MKDVLFSSPAAYLMTNANTFVTFAQGLAIIKGEDGLYATWFDKIASVERMVGIDSYDEVGNQITLSAGPYLFLFSYIDLPVYKQILEQHWLREDLVKELTSDEEVQTYMESLSAYS